MKKFSIVLYMLFLALSAAASDNIELEKIIERLRSAENISCSFKQIKTLPGVEKPIVSSGIFEFVKDEGVYFYTDYPVRTVSSYTNKEYAQINEIISAVTEGRRRRLEKEFEITAAETDENWILSLKPKSKAAEFISLIEIKGSRCITEIKIQMTNGSGTQIFFE